MTNIKSSTKWGRNLSAAFCAALWAVLTQSVALAADDEEQPTIVLPRASGKVHYMKFGCGTCHKADGSGGLSPGGPASNLLETKLTPEELVIAIADGRKGMPPYRGVIGMENIDALAVWIKDGLKQ